MTVLDLRPSQVRLLDMIEGRTVEEIEQANGGYLVFRGVDGSALRSAGPLDTVTVDRPDPPLPAPVPACFADPAELSRPGRWSAVCLEERGDFTFPLYAAPLPGDTLVEAGYLYEMWALSGAWYPKHSFDRPQASVHVRNVRAAYERKV